MLGAGLCVLAGLLAFWPRETGRGYPFIALAALLALVVTPVVSLGGTQPLLLGGVLAAGTVCFLWLERLPLRPGSSASRRCSAWRRPAPCRWPAWPTARRRGSTTGGSRRRSGPPTRCASTGRRATARSTGRGRARRSCGSRPTSRPTGSCAPWRTSTATPGATAAPTSASRTCRAPIRGSTSRTAGSGGRSGSTSCRCRCGGCEAGRSSAPGTTLRVTGSTQRLESAGEPGMWRGVEEFGRGDSYTVRAYVPRPSADRPRRGHERPPGRRARHARPARRRWAGARACRGGRCRGARGDACASVRSSPAGAGEGPAAAYPSVNRTGPGEEALRASAYARTWRLAQRLRARARTPYEYVSLVAARLRDGFTYSERPPRAAPGQAPLEAFLFEGRRGYCQQFAGAMTLLLRMGGVPARVATGFTPGGFSSPQGRVDRARHGRPRVGGGVVRPLRLGRARPDARGDARPVPDRLPDADGPAKPDPRRRTRGGGRAGGRHDARAAGRARRAAGGRRGPRTGRLGGGGERAGSRGGAALGLLLAAPAGLLGGGGCAGRRRRAGEDGAPRLDRAVAELEAALRRSGRPVAPGVTLRQLEQRLGGPPEAGAYLQRAALRPLRPGLRRAAAPDAGPAPGAPARPGGGRRRAGEGARAVGAAALARVSAHQASISRVWRPGPPRALSRRAPPAAPPGASPRGCAPAAAHSSCLRASSRRRRRDGARR